MKYPELVNTLKAQGGGYFRNMSDDLMQKQWPWIYALKGQLQPPQWHPEGDAFVHTCLVIDRALQLGGNHVELFGAMCHDLGKGLTPPEKLPHHYEHEGAGVPLVHELCDAIDAPPIARDIAWRCSKYHLLIHRFDDLKTRTRVRLIKNTEGYIRSIALVAQADAQGRGPDFIDKPYPQRMKVLLAAKALDGFIIPGDERIADKMSYVANPEKWLQFATIHLDDMGLGKKRKK